MKTDQQTLDVDDLDVARVLAPRKPWRCRLRGCPIGGSRAHYRRSQRLLYTVGPRTADDFDLAHFGDQTDD